MNPKHKVDSTLILRRIFDAPPSTVWRAWTTPEEMTGWWVAGWDHVVHFAEADVRVGGSYRVGFAPPLKTPYVESGTFSEVVPMKRLAYQETVTLSGEQIHTHATVIDFRDLGGKTEVTVSTSGWESWRNADGWVPALEKLAAHLGGEPRLRA
jgi:uncharacterized protein YndB with AHSA1/START domain